MLPTLIISSCCDSSSWHARLAEGEELEKGTGAVQFVGGANCHTPSRHDPGTWDGAAVWAPHIVSQPAPLSRLD